MVTVEGAEVFYIRASKLRSTLIGLSVICMALPAAVGEVMAEDNSSLSTLSDTLVDLLVDLLPVIIIIGVFGYILTKVKFGGK